MVICSPLIDQHLISQGSCSMVVQRSYVSMVCWLNSQDLITQHIGLGVIEGLYVTRMSRTSFCSHVGSHPVAADDGSWQPRCDQADVIGGVSCRLRISSKQGDGPALNPI